MTEWSCSYIVLALEHGVMGEGRNEKSEKCGVKANYTVARGVKKIINRVTKNLVVLYFNRSQARSEAFFFLKFRTSV